MNPLRDKLTYANVMATAAFFLAIGGTAIAVDGPNPGQNTVGSEDIIGNEVRSDDIGNGRIFNLDIADDIIQSDKVKNGTLTHADIDESSLDLGVGRSDSGGACFDVNGTGAICETVNLTLPRAGRVLAIGNARVITSQFDDTAGTDAGSDATDRAFGTCELTADGAVIDGSNQRVGERRTAAGAVSSHTDGQNVSTAVITPVMNAGTRALGIKCTDEDGNLDFLDAQVTAVALDDD